jgi:predicted nuclease with TOPRIM domain
MTVKEFLEQKAKFIQMALLGFAVICFFLFLSAVNSKQQVLRERDVLKDENTSLSGRVEQLENNLRENKNKVNSLSAELNKISLERGKLEKKYDLAKKERDELVNKLKNQPLPVIMQQPIQETAPQVSDAYWAGILRSKTVLEIQLDEMRNDLSNAKISDEKLQREKNSLELDVNNINREKEDLIRQLDYNQRLVDSISKELVMERNDKILIQNGLRAINSENAALVRQLKNLSNQRAGLDKKLQELQEQNSTLEKRFNDMQTMLSDKATQVSRLSDRLESASGFQEGTSDRKESVELTPIVVRPQQDAGEPEASVQQLASSRPKVLAINRENNFVIIDTGEDSGIKTGETLEVLRDNNPIGIIEVMQLRRDIAACDIKKETTPISVGDEIK